MDEVRALERPVHFLSIRKEYDRENRLVRVEDGTGARVCYTYDRADRLVRKEVQLIRDYDGVETVRASSITSYAYD